MRPMNCRAACIAALLVYCRSASPAEEPVTKWLVIAASHPNLQPALQTKERLQRRWPQAAIVATDDCSNLKPGLFLAVVRATAQREAAQGPLASLKSEVGDAYVRDCRVKPDSRVALDIPLVDPSIEKVPRDAVNWSDQDRVSSVRKLAGGGYLWIRRWYDPAPEDPREGRRQAVAFFDAARDRAIPLESDCTDPQSDRLGQWLALSCARQTAGDQLLHETRVYNLTTGESASSTNHCRTPRFLSASTFSCQSEEVDAAGTLHLAPKTVRFR